MAEVAGQRSPAHEASPAPAGGPVWIEPPLALIAHQRFLAEHGRERRQQVDSVRLAAALMLPRTVATFSSPPRLSVVGTRYVLGVLRMRPFAEGNQAMAFILGFLFLDLNGVQVQAPAIEKYTMFAALTDRRIGADAFAQWIRLRHLAGRFGLAAVLEVGVRDGALVRLAGLRRGSAAPRAGVGTAAALSASEADSRIPGQPPRNKALPVTGRSRRRAHRSSNPQDSVNP